LIKWRNDEIRVIGRSKTCVNGIPHRADVHRLSFASVGNVCLGKVKGVPDTFLTPFSQGRRCGGQRAIIQQFTFRLRSCNLEEFPIGAMFKLSCWGVVMRSVSRAARFLGGLLAAVWLVGFAANPIAVAQVGGEERDRLPTAAVGGDQEAWIPEILEPWKEWVTWGIPHLDSPRLYSNHDEAVSIWPSRLELSTDAQGATWTMQVRVYQESFVPLPGDSSLWPINAQAGEAAIAVIEKGGRPAVKLDAGSYRLSGAFRWKEVPQRIPVPVEIGMLTLRIAGNEVSLPDRDANGDVWLQRKQQSESTEDDQTSLRIYRVVEDGIPIWLQTEIELTVSGKSREEEIGWVIPEGWRIASVESPIPVALDEQGVMRAQVRPGKWSIQVSAFQTTDPATRVGGEIRFAAQAQRAAATELVGLRIRPEFRISQIEGLPTVDVAQTTFPERWRGLPVYQWETQNPFQLVEKMRGMGDRRPPGLSVDRRLWLDEDGQAFTYRDRLQGKMQQLWRLDVSPGHDLGAVRIAGEGQLITANPQSGVPGIEIRNRNVNVEAIGRIERKTELLATGWQSDAEGLGLTFTLPPGWRMFAVFGADEVIGDWLTAWSLLDLFLVLIFSLAVLRLFGWLAALVAIVALTLSYHEPAAPRFTWLFLLMPIGLLQVVGHGSARKWISVWKYAALGLLLLILIPFIAFQIQSAIYPQLERAGFTFGARSLLLTSRAAAKSTVDAAAMESDFAILAPSSAMNSLEDGRRVPPMKGQVAEQQARQRFDASNLLQDPRAKIQTGPAEPIWDWNNVVCRWNGPVNSDHAIRPILISLDQHRLLTIVRVLLLGLLTAILARNSVASGIFPWRKRAPAVVLAGMIVLSAPAAPAQIPEGELLETLRTRLLKPSDAFPGAAEIPSVELSLQGNRLSQLVEVHAAAECVIPLPGKLPEWSPIRVTLDDKEEVSVVRRNDYLWVLVPAGTHKVVVEGYLASESDWVWTFLLKPKYVSINAPSWQVTGVSPEGIPEPQVFFVREEPATSDGGSYTQTNYQPLVLVLRELEIGLVSRVQTTVRRLTPMGKAISVELPLIPGERVLTSNLALQNGLLPIQLGAQEESFSWTSELDAAAELPLAASSNDRWVERWVLVSSPIWNVSLTGLRPIFSDDQEELIPIWQPWPGEGVVISLSRPETVSGESMTVKKVEHQRALGSRRQSTTLKIQLECSLAGDFAIAVDPAAEITSLKLERQSIPVRRDGGQLIIPTRRGKQEIEVTWNVAKELGIASEKETISLPVRSANVTSRIQVPENRWILWADGPLRGPAVRFWAILAIAVFAAIGLGSIPWSPLRHWEWVLLGIGLTQVPVFASMVVVGWLFMLAVRGRQPTMQVPGWAFNLQQVMLVIVTFVALGILMFVVGAGLLGSPEMFIVGNQSTRTMLQWFQPRSENLLPTPTVVSVSIWFYRLLMLLWALWLAASLLRWLKWGWQQFSTGEVWRGHPSPIRTLDSPESSP